MDAIEFKRIRVALGLSQAQLAKALRLTERTVRRYEGGTRPVDGPVTVLMEAFTRGDLWDGNH